MVGQGLLNSFQCLFILQFPPWSVHSKAVFNFFLVHKSGHKYLQNLKISYCNQKVQLCGANHPD